MAILDRVKSFLRWPSVSLHADMHSLILMLEQASEGGAELDGRIWCARYGYRFAHMASNGERVMYYPWADRQDVWGHCFGRLERFTRSMDAAIALVPEGASIGAKWFPEHPVLGCHFEVGHGRKGDHPTSPAIALCIAALHCRRAQLSR